MLNERSSGIPYTYVSFQLWLRAIPLCWELQKWISTFWQVLAYTVHLLFKIHLYFVIFCNICYNTFTMFWYCLVEHFFIQPLLVAEYLIFKWANSPTAFWRNWTLIATIYCLHEFFAVIEINGWLSIIVASWLL